jgi:hypothetical protein
MVENIIGRGRLAESPLLWSAALLLHAAAPWLLHVSQRPSTRASLPPSRVTLHFLMPVAAQPTVPSPTPPVATLRRARVIARAARPAIDARRDPRC